MPAGGLRIKGFEEAYSPSQASRVRSVLYWRTRSSACSITSRSLTSSQVA